MTGHENDATTDSSPASVISRYVNGVTVIEKAIDFAIFRERDLIRIRYARVPDVASSSLPRSSL